MSSTPESTGVKRRDFLKVLGVATATTATLGCSSEDVGKLIPYVTHPDQTVPSVSNYYATTCRECAASCGVLAESREGRAFKLEGNPEHPLNRGAICSRGQAAVQGLLNPDRFRGPMMRQANGRLAPVTWDVAMQRFNQLLGQVQSQGRAAQAVFVNQHESGSFPAFLDQWLADFGMPAHVSYDAEAMPQVVAANRQSFGVAWPALDFTAARLVVSFGADFLDQFGLPVPHQLDWADARAKGAAAPRMVYVGPRRSLTGLNADQWIACRPGSELAIVNFLRGQGSAAQAAQASDVPAATLEALQREVAGTRPSLILAGSNTPTAYELALAVNQLNQSAGNVGVTIKPATPITAFDGIATGADVRELTERMAQGGVSMLMVRGANLVHTTPKALGFAAALAKVPVKVSFSSFPDETTELCDLVLPDHHALEAWGDSQPLPNVIALQQPAQDPIFQTRQTADVLILAAKANQNTAARYGFADYRAYLISRFPGAAPAFTRALQTGLAAGTIPARTAARPAATTRRQVQGGLDGTQGDMYLMVYPSTNLGDGRGANKPWLQEIPDPVTKICWQTVAEIHPTTAKRLGVQNGDRVTVATSAGSMTLPAYVYLGIRPDTVAIQLGRGHQGSTNVAFDAKAGAPHYTGYGRYADRVGQNPLSILPVAEGATAGELVLTATKARVTKADGHDELVTTEGSARQHGRGIGQAMLASELRPGGVQSDRGAEAVGARGPTPESNRAAPG
ncbi:MAG: Molybdopterin oxidoreductase, iron-sulfur binding subunit, partial [uncultured Gemmatimonadaceae bacterium]